MTKKRIRFLDLARGFAVLTMIMQHAVLVYDAGMGEDSLLGLAFVILGTAPAAPVFMTIMGLLFMRSTSVDVMRYVKRGLGLVGLGYVLNACRFTLPLLLTGAYTSRSGDPNAPLALLWSVDILQMAGLSLIVMALLKRYVPWPAIWIGLAGSIIVLSPLVWGIQIGFPFTDLLWGTGKNVSFPLFPWLAYPLVGMAYGRWMLKNQEQATFMKKSAAMGACLFIIGILTLLLPSRGVFVIGDYYRSGVSIHLLLVGFVLLWLPLCWIVVEKVPPNPVFNLAYCWSENVTPIYFIQWVVIAWGGFLLNYNAYSALTAVLIGGIAVVITHVLTVVYMRRRRSRRQVVNAGSLR